MSDKKDTGKYGSLKRDCVSVLRGRSVEETSFGEEQGTLLDEDGALDAPLRRLEFRPDIEYRGRGPGRGPDNLLSPG